MKLLKTNKHRGYHGSALSFIDMLWNLLLVFTMLFLLAILQIATQDSANKAPEQKAEYILQLDWNDYSPADIDLWLRTPDDQSIGYLRLQGGWVSLDRDDRGVNSVFDGPDGKESLPTRREVISIKRKVPGRYIANAMYFRMNAPNTEVGRQHMITPVPCRIQLIQINPYKILFTRDFVLEREADEVTAVSWVVGQKGEVTDINTTTETFVKSLGGSPPNLGPTDATR
jgi:hypothetical protein